MKWKTLTVFAAIFIAVCYTNADAQYSFTYNAEKPASVSEVFTIGDAHSDLVNTGSADDTYYITITKDLPDDWSANICVDSMCFGDSVEWELEAGGSSDVKPSFFPPSAGEGWVTVQIKSQNNPTDLKQIDFYFACGYNTLLVNGDPGDNYGEYYDNALGTAGLEYNHWYQWHCPLYPEDAEMFDTIIWFSGDSDQPLSEHDIAGLTAFLEGNGDLFMTGQGLAANMDSSFAHDYLYFRYIDDTECRDIEGIPSDLISDGFSFEITGSGGANNQAFPAMINHVEGATPTLAYAEGGAAGVKYNDALHQVVFFSFGFEAINDEQTRNDLFAKILEFFDMQTGVDESEGGTLPISISITNAYPNPFNSSANIELSNPTTRDVSVSIYDIRGRLVEKIFEGELRAGTHILTWNAQNAASGIYFCRINGSADTGRAMVLIK
ncbi:MAG: T9SS type A sorting domain-containing protein [candidate division Zixibacteria bacterium]|nr:T9SS type A sorting domain-containing protein [candidate division Zixibacteria bacterium]